jgi:hypothetical protein
MLGLPWYNGVDVQGKIVQGTIRKDITKKKQGLLLVNFYWRVHETVDGQAYDEMQS